MKTRPCIYIVDDDEDDVFLMRQALLSNGMACDVHTFTNGVELMRWITKSESVNWPSMIIIDLNMPVMNGFETIQSLKKYPDYDKIPLLMLTTSAAEGDQVRAYSLGVNSFIVKPSRFEQLQEIIRHTLHCWLGNDTQPGQA